VPTEPASREESSRILLRAVGALSTSAMARMEAEKEWFRELSAEDRSWVGLIVQTGIRGFVHWYAEHGDETTVTSDAENALAAEVFGAAPRALAGVISLEHTVELVRLTIDVVEESLNDLLGAPMARDVHNGLLRYGRELAFATAEVYARAAEARGAWDARLEALVVDAVVRAEPDDSVLSRASALGWGSRGHVVVVLGRAPHERPQLEIFEDVRRSARAADLDAMCAVQGDRIVVVLGGVQDPAAAAKTVSAHLSEGPVVHGPAVPALTEAHLSATAAASGLRAAPAWPDAPRPVSSDDLLPERALSGDESARDQLVEEVFRPLAEGRGTLVETLEAWFGNNGSVEATARALFVHPNTVRYRLKQAADLTGFTPAQPRHGYALRLAITLGRLTRG
jgi:DNA-binding PucR family transcriptional regulator